MEAIYICIFQRREKRVIVNGSNPNSNQESAIVGVVSWSMIIVCPGNLRRDGGGGQSSVMREGRHCGHLRHRSLALEFALESSRRAFALTILSPNSNSHPNKCQCVLMWKCTIQGLLLDVGRNPILFPLSWLCRQGVFSPWARKSRPFLEGDNWWRGHSAAFLKYVKLIDDVLRKGCANQVSHSLNMGSNIVNYHL
nr:sn1-specific diacylglycerol lipase beta isoform X3 [Ipomoea batatas]